MPPQPKGLSRKARKHWNEIGPVLAERGLLAVVDGGVFTAYCDTLARLDDVLAELRVLEDLEERTPNGFKVPSVKFSNRNKLIDQLVRLGREIGATAAARSAIKEPAQQQLALGGWDEL